MDALHDKGAVAVRQYDRLIDQEARRQGVDPDLVKAIVYVENAHGHYFGLSEVSERHGLAKTILPMNVNPDPWAKLGFKDDDFHNPAVNIRVGVTLIKRIEDRLDPTDRTPDKVASIYHFLGGEKVDDYGARVAEVRKTKAWLAQ